MVAGHLEELDKEKHMQFLWSQIRDGGCQLCMKHL